MLNRIFYSILNYYPKQFTVMKGVRHDSSANSFNSNAVVDLTSPKFLINLRKFASKPSFKENPDLTKVVGPSIVDEIDKPAFRSRQKIRNNNTEEDTLENKKYKSKKKDKRIVELQDEDNDLYQEDSGGSKNTTADLSVARPPKPLKKKRKIEKKHKPDQAETSYSQHATKAPSAVEERSLRLSRPITIVDFSELLGVSEREIIKALFVQGTIATINQLIDIETAKELTKQLKPSLKIETSDYSETDNDSRLERLNIELVGNLNATKRPPVVTIMGHVDHGKTTLIDAIQKTKMADKEAGGITQGIGAYEIYAPGEKGQEKIVFLDTPGHQAFTAMRSRGAKVTDIALLIVAADDGIQPQTIEAIDHIHKANSPYIVVITKIDKADANSSKIQEQLMQYGVVVDTLGGHVPIVEISALKNINIDKLLTTILLVADLEQLIADPDSKAVGTVIEAHLDKTRGPIATLLVQNGKLSLGDLIVTGTTSGKTRAMLNTKGDKIDHASPSTIVQMLGLSAVANSGDNFQVVDKEKEAKTIIDQRKLEKPFQHSLSNSRVILSNQSASKEQHNIKLINLLLKTDSPGSLEAILNALSQIPQQKIQIKVVYMGTGDISQKDMELAYNTQSIILGFNSVVTSSNKHSLSNKISIQSFDVIYDLIDCVEQHMKSLLDEEFDEQILGSATVKTTFSLTKGVVAGCYVDSGKLERDCCIRIIRNADIIAEAKLDSLKRVKEDINEIGQGNECGVVSDSFTAWNKDDTIQAYKLVPRTPSLS
uniref:translation initiation factor 2 n=1 Tax=Timspurckia oligopyrenoides TaxID=708627 RepID=UPI001FCD7C3B|nr:translation initiation factor 2 [Timspurckia oligopyrenoides]UNJ17579.1 translation initiation factor 2 [Timspurckia oligopyrenoides]